MLTTDTVSTQVDARRLVGDGTVDVRRFLGDGTVDVRRFLGDGTVGVSFTPGGNDDEWAGR
jgi:hypothetical protein